MASCESGDGCWLFVYGTLKRGDCRHHYLSGARCLGVAVTVPGYRLFHCGTYPGMIRDDSSSVVEGELYQIDPQRLEVLDEVEGVSDGLYMRAEVQLQPPYEGRRVIGYLYHQSVAELPEISGGVWSKGLRP